MRYAITVLAGLTLALALACGGGSDGENGGNNQSSNGDGTSPTQAPAATQASGGGNSSSGGAIANACLLLTDQQVAAAMGENVATKAPTIANQAVASCRWDGASTGRRYVAVTVRQVQAGTPVFNNSYKSRADGQAVPGIGKEAVVLPGANSPNDYRFATGAILTDRHYIQVDVAGPNRDDAAALGALTTAMRTVVGALR